MTGGTFFIAMRRGLLQARGLHSDCARHSLSIWRRLADPRSRAMVNAEITGTAKILGASQCELRSRTRGKTASPIAGGNYRNNLLDHVIVPNERHPRRLMNEYPLLCGSSAALAPPPAQAALSGSHSKGPVLARGYLQPGVNDAIIFDLEGGPNRTIQGKVASIPDGTLGHWSEPNLQTRILV